MTIVTKQQLKDQRNLTDTFIRKNDLELGGRGKPRRYDMDLVDDFLYRYFRELLHQEQAVKQQTEQLHRDIDTYIKTSRQVQTGQREMVGRGGKSGAGTRGNGGAA